ncbi:hypothetical protein [Roseateles chitinivorans]|uniref:hypothetical protein n=1 Tax=Roseateles chitinivorans TaxID=2917965 RepID=UPI003D67B05E
MQFMAAVIAAVPRLHKQALERLAQALRHLRQQVYRAAEAARIERGGTVRRRGEGLVHPWFQISGRRWEWHSRHNHQNSRNC